MPAQDISYIEFYTGDFRSTLDYFVSSLGFTRVAESFDSAWHSVLLRQGGVRLVVTEGSSTRAFLDVHGDGIADIAFSCDDVARTRDAALAAGATLAGSGRDQVTVTAAGDIRHTLVAAPEAARLPAGRHWRTVPPGAGRPAARSWIRLLDHVAICLTSGTLTDWADFYSAAFGLPRYSGDYTEMGDQAMNSLVVRSPSGGITLTLLEQDKSKKPGQIEGFLARNEGPGVQHLAFAVDDIISAVNVLGSRDVEFLRTPAAYYEILAEKTPGLRAEIAALSAVNVLADRDEWGYLLQLFTRSPYPRNTMFYELIQRRGARGFGSANIKALYEAVERDGLAAR